MNEPAKIFTLPDLGEGLAQAELLSWHVGLGDHVVEGQPLASVETDKAVVEVPSPRAGEIARLCAQVGEQVKVGAPLVEFVSGASADTGTVVGAVAVGSAVLNEAAQAVGRSGAGLRATPAVRAIAQRPQRHQHQGRCRARGARLCRNRATGTAHRHTAGDGHQHGQDAGRSGHRGAVRRC